VPTITDTFTGNQVDLLDHVATGVNGGFAWQRILGGTGLRLVNNQLVSDGSIAHTALRADIDLATSNQFAEIKFETWLLAAPPTSITAPPLKCTTASR
jgi:hypothetical protein